MVLILKPPGRGKWEPVIVSITGRRVDNLFYRVGQRYSLDGTVYRIAEVRA